MLTRVTGVEKSMSLHYSWGIPAATGKEKLTDTLLEMNRALRIFFVLMALILFACGQSSTKDTVSTSASPEGTSSATEWAEISYQGIPWPLPEENKHVGAPPPAWLVFNKRIFPALNAAFQTLQAHVDPAEAFPDLPLVTIPDQAEFIIIIASDSVTEFRASVVQWSLQVNPLPLVQTQGQSVTHKMRVEDMFTIFEFAAIYPSQEQFLHAYLAFSQSSTNVEGYSHYLWRITPGK